MRRDHGLTIDGNGGSDKMASRLETEDITARMRWFRDTLRQGAWLALIALALNLGLSFGHFHAIDGKASRGGIAAVAASIVSPDDGQRQGNSDESHADFLCPICMAATAIANAHASTPPSLHQPLANASIDRPLEPAFAVAEPPRAAFQSRGPPISA